jgi:hypothetical protein
LTGLAELAEAKGAFAIAGDRSRSMRVQLTF